ncbi:hypothetical protein P7K49_032404, partial [Saguinus oedipus]
MKHKRRQKNPQVRERQLCGPEGSAPTESRLLSSSCQGRQADACGHLPMGATSRPRRAQLGAPSPGVVRKVPEAPDLGPATCSYPGKPPLSLDCGPQENRELYSTGYLSISKH